MSRTTKLPWKKKKKKKNPPEVELVEEIRPNGIKIDGIDKNWQA